MTRFKGDSINGYRLTTDFSSAGGGQSMWAFAVKDGEEFFIKRFLQPKYPVPDAPGSQAVKARKRRQCEAFEEQQNAVLRKLARFGAVGGNLIVTREFFRHGPHYHKTTAKVEAAPVSPATLAGLPPGDLIRIMLTVTQSLGILHQHGLVHGDIKAGNILVKRTATGRYTTKLIDFDDCYPERVPPPPDELVVDQAYCGPETVAYLCGADTGDRLSTKADIFALGVVFCEFLTGSKPPLAGGARYAADAVRSDQKLTVPAPADRRALGELAEMMMRADPDRRPSCTEVHEALKRVQQVVPDSRSPVATAPPGGPRLKGSLLRDNRPGPVPSGEVTSDGTLRGRLIPKSGSLEPAETFWVCPDCEHANLGHHARCVVCYSAEPRLGHGGPDGAALRITNVGPHWIEVSGPSGAARDAVQALLGPRPGQRVVVYSPGADLAADPLLGLVRIRGELRPFPG